MTSTVIQIVKLQDGLLMTADRKKYIGISVNDYPKHE